MALFLEGTVASSTMETSNFAHVIFQNVGKSYLPHAALECHYTLTQFIKPNPKDWVGIFKVGWSTARDYYTFLWSPLPDNYTEGTAINRSVVFQGYYVPNDDAEFYQFCYVTHKGEIRGASTPFQFRANSPTEEELLTVEDEGGSDILVVTTKASYLEQKMEQIQQEKKELLENLDLFQKERDELIDEKNRLQKEYELEQESSAQLRKDVQELQLSAQSLQEEKEEVKRRMEESTARLLQLEEDLIGVTQKGLQKETELDCLKDRVKKLTLEKEALECQLKNEKDEKELYKGESNALKEQLRQKEEQLQATQQQANMLKAELRDSSNARDRSMADLYRIRLEAESLKKGQTEARAECSRMEKQLEEMKNSTQQEAQCKETEGLAVVEMQREVEDLRLRLQMAAEHYKDKYKECQKFQKQVAKLSEQPGVKRSPGSEPLSASPEASAPGSPGTSDAVLDAIIHGRLKSASKEPDKNDKYRKCKQLLSEERERCSMINDELTKMEVKLREQMKTNEGLRMQLAAEEDRYKSQVAEKGRELRELKDSLFALTKEKEKLEGELQRSVSREEEHGKKDGSLDVQSVFLQYPMPYPLDDPSPLLVPQRPTDLMFGNPYSSTDSRDGADGEFSDDQMPRLPPVGPPSWDSNVVCIQPARNLSRPDGLEEPEEPQTTPTNDQPTATDPAEFLNDGQIPFCFEPSGEQKRCPLCEVIFPPHYDQSKFEEHVESHWKICPMCSEQFPLDCDQQLFEKHVLTHFDSNVLNF
ncbi:tax1-binding protein 1 homolog B isoform X4 [Rhinichthys klamathensis goyatoka]|uniref:tax1-binding protein 1 homolog B isoform X4 n=1 Tax=Rhinichthys klamathensis goyatoka TaxID=3034132 RepID=UPI0024B51573|nr:tax1-binding protein 1 homolog B isoform X4 [Rhinichthys klamathensis goyatoka]